MFQVTLFKGAVTSKKTSKKTKGKDIKIYNIKKCIQNLKNKNINKYVCLCIELHSVTAVKYLLYGNELTDNISHEYLFFI